MSEPSNNIDFAAKPSISLGPQDPLHSVVESAFSQPKPNNPTTQTNLEMAARAAALKTELDALKQAATENPDTVAKTQAHAQELTRIADSLAPVIDITSPASKN
jgi:hypothetical protein